MKGCSGGFVLVEVLLAAAVMAVGLTAYHHALGGVRRAAARHHERFVAGLLLEAKVLETERVGRFLPGLGPVEGPLSPAAFSAELLPDGVGWGVTLAWGEGPSADELTLAAVP